MDAEIDKVQYKYYRIPYVSTINIPEKGRPHSVHLHHYVRGEGFASISGRMSPRSKGGKVICTITTKDGEEHAGEAYCSCSDNFCYKLGREISLGRAEDKRRNEVPKKPGMTSEEMERLANEASKEMSDYIEKTGNLHVGLAYATILSTIAQLSLLVDPDDLVAAMEMVIKQVKGFLSKIDEEH